MVRRFHALMSHRIRAILMVSTRYEAFSLAGDGSLTNDIYGTYALLHLQNVPQITTMTSGREALDTLQREKYDMVIVSSNLSDMTVPEFCLAVKGAYPEVPVVMLVFVGSDLPAVLQKEGCQGVDYVFSWQGSAKVLLSIIKLVEDSLNIDHDIQIVRIGVILFIEDSIKQYSFFLPHLYTMLMKQAFSRVPYGVDENERQLRTRTRPKVLLARTFAEAETLADRYRSFLHGVISDLVVTCEEEKGYQVGKMFLSRLQETIPGLPMLLISADEAAPEVARSLGISFVDKKSPRFIEGLENFCTDGLGFGDFVFRDQQGQEICRARNFREFENALRTVPEESIAFHSHRNQFSHWLLAQGESGLAELIRPLKVADFKSPAEMREVLIESVQMARREKHRGIITDFRVDDFEPDYSFLMMGSGSLGGKGRGLVFMSQLLNQHSADNRLGGVEVNLPRTLVITTDTFDAFMAENDLYAFAIECDDDVQLQKRFLEAVLPESLCVKLRAYLDLMRVPLAVRSSSHMEDSSNQPFAGLYRTFMLPNVADDTEKRLDELSRAVRMVYASAYTTSVKRYFQTLKLNMEEEKMAVIVQELVGRRYGDLFYPAVSGVAQSFNYYPFSRMEPEDGVASVALGFGKMVVEGGDAFRFCPHHPMILPQAAAPQDMARVSQKQFFALDLTRPYDFSDIKGMSLTMYDLDRAEQDLTLHPVGSVLSAQDDRIVDDLAEKGPRLITFAPILKRGLFPLSDVLSDLLRIGKENMGSDVEIEFAVNIDYHRESEPEFYLLQIRPMVTSLERISFKMETLDMDHALCASRKVMGNGIVEDIHDIIYCHPARFDFSTSRKVADVIGRLNQSFLDQEKQYILVGPGRWGTRMPSLGVPVNWQQVAGSAVIVETAVEGKRFDPSQGAHFFHNLAATGIGYFSVTETDRENFVRWEALEQFPAVYEDNLVRHVRLDRPVTVCIDAMDRRGVII